MQIDIRQEELQALDIILNKAEAPIKVGMILGLFRTRIQEELNKIRENQLKEKVSTYEALIKVYQENEATYTEEVKTTKRDEIITIEQDIQKFQKNGSSLVQIRQNELMNPLYQLIGDVMNTIATEEKFTQIFTIDNSIAYLDPTFDITKKVMVKLGIPIPEEGK